MERLAYPITRSELNLFLTYGMWFGGCAVTAFVALSAGVVMNLYPLMVVSGVAMIGAAISAIQVRRLKVRIIRETDFLPSSPSSNGER